MNNSNSTSNEDRVNDIREQIRSLDGGDKIVNQRVINDLPNVLQEDEQITGALTVFHGVLGLLIATDSRVLWVNRKSRKRLTVEEFFYESITSIRFEVKGRNADISLNISGYTVSFSDASPRETAQSFCKSVEAYITNKRVARGSKENQPSPNQSTVTEMLDALERLGHLRDRGVLSDLEFTEQKRRILSITNSSCK